MLGRLIFGFFSEKVFRSYITECSSSLQISDAQTFGIHRPKKREGRTTIMKEDFPNSFLYFNFNSLMLQSTSREFLFYLNFVMACDLSFPFSFFFFFIKKICFCFVLRYCYDDFKAFVDVLPELKSFLRYCVHIKLNM